ncbi:MAG TPA: lysylphosphatidylglycerol synthase domain-containing protein [Kofleriaceae bacterium]|nr:lysylphosphatidylglycerol synthase domain-containing protein [Kofleriaceae bacterium]
MSPVRHAKKAIPYAVAAAALIWVGVTTNFSKVEDAWARVSWWKLLAIAVPYLLGLLVADAIALWVTVRVSLRVPLRFVDVLLVRGASWLLALVNYGAGQGGIVWFLHRRHGVPIARATGAVLLATGGFLLAVVGAVAGGLALQAVPEANVPAWLLWLVAIGFPVYLGIIAARPAFLTKSSLLEPLFAAGITGTILATVTRALHLAVLIAAHALAYRQFGIDIPFRACLVVLPVIFLAGALPISVAGYGAPQATASLLLARYVHGPDATGTVVAASIGFQTLTTILMALIGMIALRWEVEPAPETPTETTT